MILFPFSKFQKEHSNVKLNVWYKKCVMTRFSNSKLPLPLMMNVADQLQSGLKSIGGSLTYGDFKSLFEFNEMGRLNQSSNT